MINDQERAMNPPDKPNHGHENGDEQQQPRGEPPEHIVNGPNYLVTIDRIDDIIRLFAVFAGAAMVVLIALSLWHNNPNGVLGHLIGLLWAGYILIHYNRIRSSPEVDIHPHPDGTAAAHIEHEPEDEGAREHEDNRYAY